MMQEYIGELCPKCRKSRLNHPAVYIFECPSCKFKYKCDPTDRPPITVLHKSIPLTNENSPKREETNYRFIKVSNRICPLNQAHRLVSYGAYCKNNGITKPEYPIKDDLLYCRKCGMFFQDNNIEVKK